MKTDMNNDMRLPTDLVDDLHEDLTNVYLRYFDRYKGGPDENEQWRTGRVICTMLEVLHKIEDDLFKKAVMDFLDTFSQEDPQ